MSEPVMLITRKDVFRQNCETGLRVSLPVGSQLFAIVVRRGTMYDECRVFVLRPVSGRLLSPLLLNRPVAAVLGCSYNQRSAAIRIPRGGMDAIPFIQYHLSDALYGTPAAITVTEL